MPVIYSHTKWDAGLADADGDYARVAVESGLDFVKANTNYLLLQTATSNFIPLENQWCISFFTIIRSTASDAILETRDGSNGYLIRLRLQSGLIQYQLSRSGSTATDTRGVIGMPYASNDWVHIVIMFNPPPAGISGFGEWTVYENARLVGVQAIVSNTGTVSTFGARQAIGATPTGGLPYDGVLSGMSFFIDKLLTPQEIQYIHQNGGVIPESAHADCVAHYPLTQRAGYFIP